MMRLLAFTRAGADIRSAIGHVAKPEELGAGNLHVQIRGSLGEPSPEATEPTVGTEIINIGAE